jgi:hypothetical protein
VNWLVGIMTVPLVQNLIHHAINTENEGGSDMVELFALGVLPRVATCDPRAYEYLLKLDVLDDLDPDDSMTAIAAIQSVYPCLGLTCADVGDYMGGEVSACVDPNNASPFQQRGYTATSGSARSLSKIDRDILQIDVFLKYEANDLALDWYSHGWNSELSLHTLAIHNFVPESSDSYYSVYDAFFGESEYFAEAGFLNAKINNLLTGLDETFKKGNASPEQLRSAVTGLLLYVVMFLNIADSLKFAASQCGSGDSDAAKKFVDASAMFFIGSMANTNSNSGGFENGKSLFVMAQVLCNDFDTCIKRRGENAGAAAASELFITSLNTLAEKIDSSNCEEVESLVESTVLPALTVPLIQGLLKQASYNANLSKASMDPGLVAGDVLSRSILPLVDQASPQSANVIKVQMEYQLSEQPVGDGFKAVADAFRGTLPDMGISCDMVGVLVDEPIAGNICGDGVTASKPSSPRTALGFGRYEFSDPILASSHAAFALDVRDMFNAATTEKASLIYKQGANAINTNLYAEDFIGEPSTPSLASLSILANEVMNQDPIFNIYKYALYDDEDFDFDSGERFSYADDIVVEALGDGDDTKLAAEATVVLQIFTAITKNLYEAVRSCSDGISPELQLDSAVALWIGELQGEGKFDDGFMLYSIAQSVEKFYGHDEGESPINAILMNLFLQAQSTAKKCSDDSVGATTNIRTLSHEIIRLLTQPMIQSLIFHMTKSSKNMVELYAVAALPPFAACDPEAFDSLQSIFYSGYDNETSITDELLDNLAIFLRCQRISCDNIKTGKNADENLSNIVDKLCDRLGKDPNSNLPIAGYAPTYSVNEEARLDLDALEVYIMMRTRAYEAAQDIYIYGHNSDGSQGKTLLSLLNGASQDPSADNLIMHAMKQKLQFEISSREELSEIVRRTLQSIVSYNAVITKIEYAIDQCENGSIDNARQEWDTAVAYFAGSMEGGLAGGKSNRHGIWMYALGNEFCQDFGTCETSGEATVNEKLMFDFAKGRDSMADGQCDDLKTLVSGSMTSKLLVPHIQGIISSAIKLNALSDLNDNPELLATAHILTKLMIPKVETLDTAASSLLSDTFGGWRSVSNKSPVVSDIVNSFASILSDLGIPCDIIGNPVGTGLSLCEVGTDLPNEENPTILANDLYVTKTYVQDFANIAGDIRDIAEAIGEGHIEQAQLIYREGKNSEKYDENGMRVRVRSLKWFSTQSTINMLDEPEFIKFLYTLGNQMYADELVEEAIEKSILSKSDIASEAALVLNLWMEIVHMMHGALQGCKSKQLQDDDGVFLMDAAVAYWIGDGQIAGDGDNGHLFYALSERFGQTFNIENAGQSRTNTNILKLFNAAKNEVSLPNACSDNQYTYTNLRGIVNKLIPQMAIPLIQGLILSLRANDRDKVKIYSHAYIPLVAGCRPSLFQALYQKFFSGEEYSIVEVESIIDLIRQSYDCLGLKCDDIGILEAEKTEDLPACKDPRLDTALAGYRPASDVRQYSRFDLDISEMDILLQMKAYSAAEELYTYGKHVRGANGATASFGQLATTKHRNVVPEFDKFKQYYDDEDSFADEIIRGAISSSKLDWEDKWTDEQRRVLVIRTIQVLVTYFAALQNAYEAVADCRAQTSSSQPSDSWDKAAALLIGSLEGTEKNGTSEGYMLFELGQEHCIEFGTCADDTTSNQVNEEMLSLLYTGRGAVLSGSCRALEKAANEISSLLLIPIIQGALSTSSALTIADDFELRAEAYVYGRALVPFVRKRKAANDIDSYLAYPGPSDKRHTEQKVYAALATAYPRMNVDCEDIGMANGNDTCSGVVYVSDYIWYVVGSVCVLLFACCGVCIWLRTRRKSAEPENNPRFITPRGEMNHSMDLLEKAFNPRQKITPNSSHSDSSGEEELLNKKYIDEMADDIDDASDAFTDEDDDLKEIVRLTSRGRRNQEPDII